MERSIVGFRRDEAGDWVAELSCGHTQHTRHDPPWQDRPWVLTEEGRAQRLGLPLDCRTCDGPVFATRRLPAARDAVAPDGSDVRVLLGLPAGGMAHFALGPGQTSTAVTHRTVEEIWFVVAGRGEMWRRQQGREEVVALEPGTCVTIPLGTHFQFRAAGPGPLEAVAVTMPPWPGEGEAVIVEGPWTPTVP